MLTSSRNGVCHGYHLYLAFHHLLSIKHKVQLEIMGMSPIFGHKGIKYITFCANPCSRWLGIWVQSSPLPNSGRSLWETPLCWGASIVLLENRVQSQTVKIWDCHWLPNLISLSQCIDITSNDGKPCSFSEGDAIPYHHTASTKRCYAIGAAISIAFSASPNRIGRIWTTSANVPDRGNGLLRV